MFDATLVYLVAGLFVLAVFAVFGWLAWYLLVGQDRAEARRAQTEHDARVRAIIAHAVTGHPATKGHTHNTVCSRDPRFCRL